MLCDLLESPFRGESNRYPLHTILLRNYGNHAENLVWSSIKVSWVRRCSRNVIKQHQMCNSSSQIMAFPGNLLFHLIVCKLFSLHNLALGLS